MTVHCTKTQGEALSRFIQFLHSSWAISVKGIATHTSLAHTNLVAFMYKHFSLLQTRELSKFDNSNVYVQPPNSTTQQNNFEVTPMWSHFP